MTGFWYVHHGELFFCSCRHWSCSSESQTPRMSQSLLRKCWSSCAPVKTTTPPLTWWGRCQNWLKNILWCSWSAGDPEFETPGWKCCGWILNILYIVFFLLYFVHMHLIMNGSLRPWTPCFHWAETWFILISQTASWTSSLRVRSQISTLTQTDQFLTLISSFGDRFWECWGGQEVEAVCCSFLHFPTTRRTWKTAAELPSGH